MTDRTRYILAAITILSGTAIMLMAGFAAHIYGFDRTTAVGIITITGLVTWLMFDLILPSLEGEQK